MPEFTQGKWIYDEPFGVIFSEETCAVIANVQGAGTGSCFCLTQEGQANARLIANAPEMYRLMKSVVDFDHTAFKFDTDGNLVFTREKYDEFRDLLARIDGKESDKT